MLFADDRVAHGIIVLAGLLSFLCCVLLHVEPHYCSQSPKRLSTLNPHHSDIVSESHNVYPKAFSSNH